MTKLCGRELLDRPSFNKEAAFTALERKLIGLDKLLPPHVETLDHQAEQRLHSLPRMGKRPGRHINLRAQQDNNQVLFYRVLLDHREEMMPVVYTPGLALGSRQFLGLWKRGLKNFVSKTRFRNSGNVRRTRWNLIPQTQ